MNSNWAKQLELNSKGTNDLQEGRKQPGLPDLHLSAATPELRMGLLRSVSMLCKLLSHE